MKHRIVVLGAGYAGTAAAGYLARHLDSTDFEITVVNAEDSFVERIRLHQVAAGDKLPRHGLAEMFAGTGIRLRVARVRSVDAERRTVTVRTDDALDGAAEELEYDTLLYALGSSAADHGVPGVTEHAFHVTERPAALRLAARLDGLDEGARVLVVGGGLTAIETATEIAEAKPGLRVALATSGQVGDWLSPAARGHLLRAFERLGVELREHATVEEVGATSVTAGGTVVPADVTVWAAGFAVHPIAASSGMAVEADGRLIVDRQMRSVSHPGVYAVGDAAFAIGDNGRPLPMSCASAGFTRMQATAAIVGDLTGRPVSQTPLAYFGNCISLGKHDGLFQRVDGDARSGAALRGRPAAWFKAFVYRGTIWSMAHPTNGLPARARRAAAAKADAAEPVVS